MLSEVEARSRLRLHEGENPLAAYEPSIGGSWPLFVITLGLYAIWRRRTAFGLTDRRVIYKKGVINKIERSVPLTMIQDATVSNQFWVGTVRISTAGGALSVERLTPLRPSDARILADMIVNRAHAARSATTAAPTTPAPDVVEQIRRLGELRESGVLSSEEFESKKADLLGRL